jgi:hypothetical protein
MALSETERKRSQRERTAASRERAKQRVADSEAGNEQRSKDQFDQWRVANRLVSPGERQAFVNCETAADALQVCREFLAALHQPDIMVNESLLSAERRVIEAWIAIGAPLLNRNSLRFDEETGSTIDGFTVEFDSKWIALPGANEVIDVASLPALEIPTVVEVPAAPPAPPAPQWDDPAFKNYRTPEVVATCKAQQDACDADARRISAKNLKRETEREKRVGVGYAYDVAE